MVDDVLTKVDRVAISVMLGKYINENIVCNS